MTQYPEPWRRGEYYHFSYTDAKGRRRNRSTGVTTKGEARRVIKEFIDRAASVRVADMSVREYLEPYWIRETCPYVRFRLSEGKPLGESYVKGFRALLENHVFKQPFSEILMRDLKTRDFLELRNQIAAEKGPSIANRVAASLKTIFRHAVLREDIDRDPTAGIGNIQKKPESRGILLEEETLALFSPDNAGLWKDPRRRIGNLIASETGMRRAEIAALVWGDCDFDQQIITVRHSWKQVENDHTGTTKSGKIRQVPMTAQLEEELSEYRDDILTCSPTDFVIAWDNGEPVHPSTVVDAFKAALDALGVDRVGRNITFHSYRHTKATRMLQAGITMQVVQEILGHVKVETTMGYTKFEPAYLVEQIRRTE